MGLSETYFLRLGLWLVRAQPPCVLCLLPFFGFFSLVPGFLLACSLSPVLWCLVSGPLRL